MRANKGFTLVGLMMALSIAAIATLAAMSGAQYLMRINQLTDQNLDLIALENEINHSLNTQEGCRHTFVGTDPTETGGAPNVIKDRNGNAIMTVGQDVGKRLQFKIVSFGSFRRDDPSDATRGSVAYEVTFERRGEGALGGKEYKRNFYINITLNAAGNSITDCVASGTSMLESLWKKVPDEDMIYYDSGRVLVGTSELMSGAIPSSLMGYFKTPLSFKDKLMTNDEVIIQTGGSFIHNDEEIVPDLIRIGKDAGRDCVVNDPSNLAQGVIFGKNAGKTSTNCRRVAFFGYGAGENANLTNSLAIGTYAGKGAQGANNTLIGYNSGINVDGDFNYIIGNNSPGSANMSNSFYIGHEAAGAATANRDSFMIGYRAGYNNHSTTASDNICIGSRACETLSQSEAGQLGGNIAIGYLALSNNQSASNNIVIGSQSALNARGATVTRNFIIGSLAGNQITNQATNDNFFIGHGAGANFTTGQNVYLLGKDADVDNNRIASDGNDNYFNFMNLMSGNILPDGPDVGTHRVGIGLTNPRYTLHVAGKVRVVTDSVSCEIDGSGGGCEVPSDRRLKKDIKDLDFDLEKLFEIEPVSYQWKASYSKDQRRKIGFIAQDVESVFPSLVHIDKHSGLKMIDYNGLIAPMVVSTQKLHNMCEDQRKEVEQLRKKLKKVRALAREKLGANKL